MIHQLLNISQNWKNESGSVSMHLQPAFEKVGRFVEQVIKHKYYLGARSEGAGAVFAGHLTINFPAPHNEGRDNQLISRCLALLQASKALRTATR